MKRQIRKERDYPMLGAALKSFRHAEFAKFYGVFGRLQIGWNLFCSRKEWVEFQTWFKPLIDQLRTRKVSYVVFRNQLADHMEQLSNPNTHDKLILLAREAFNCKDDEELYKKGKEIFELKNTIWQEIT